MSTPTLRLIVFSPACHSERRAKSPLAVSWALHPALVYTRDDPAVLARGLEPRLTFVQQQGGTADPVHVRIERRRRRGAAIAHGLGGLQQPLPHADDAQIAGAQVLFAALVNRPHALLHGGV